MTRDFTPLFRTAIGFDRLAQVVDGLQEAASNTFPPYNIEKTGDDTYRVSVAVAGFAPEDLDVTVRDRHRPGSPRHDRKGRNPLSRDRRTFFRAAFRACRPHRGRECRAR
jgi:HSP20 family molecular chaperone IbpA